jgi:hypothetical protein
MILWIFVCSIPRLQRNWLYSGCLLADEESLDREYQGPYVVLRHLGQSLGQSMCFEINKGLMSETSAISWQQKK